MKSIVRYEALLVLLAGMFILGSARGQTVVWSDNFDDGNGNNRWYADSGVWQIGTPTIGPETNSAGYSTYSGPDCATTGLSANYPAGLNSRLVRIQTFTVPQASQFPRLCFWHWYNFGWYYINGANYSYDYGVVEARLGTTGAWQALSPHFTIFSGDWTFATVDLSAFAGQTIQLAFHVVGSVGNEPGWYIDNVSVVTGIPHLSNSEGFETGIGDWSADQGIWQVGSPAKAASAPTNAFGTHVYTGTNCAVTVLNTNYPTSVNSRLISPYFVLPPASSAPFLRFWHWYDLGWYYINGANYSYDYGEVEIQVGTNAWQAISPKYMQAAGAYWTEPYVDLTSYGGQTVRLGFHIVGSVGNHAGWYIDDVQIYPNATSCANPYVNTKLDSSGTNVVMNWTWLPEYSGYGLQSIATNFTKDSANWDPTNWTAVVPSPVVVNGQNVLTNPASGAEQYFRLQLQGN